METHPDVEFDFFLARELRMSVAEMRERVSQEEWTAWQVYFARKNQREELAVNRAKGGK